LTDYNKAYEEADIIAFLVSHKEFKALDYKEDKIILDFSGVFKRS
jgi:UDP-N-acetyl-D-mannosaminuronic acid dehydrogenase